MPLSHGTAIRRLGLGDLALMKAMLVLFGEVFEEPETYGGAVPRDGYLQRLLAGDHFLAFVAVKGEAVVGGLAAYVLEKFEQERREIYIYDLAVAEPHRRQGIATALIRATQREAAALGAWVIMIQADHGDAAPVALYSKLGTREAVLHFDIAVEPAAAPTRRKPT